MWRVSRTERAQRGFTLLEILVALSIFAIASLLAYRGLDAVVSIKSSLDREIRFWRQLGQVFDRMESDFVQISPQLFRADDGQLYPPLNASSGGSPSSSGSVDGVESAGFLIELARFDTERSPVHVLYRCADEELKLRIEPLGGRPRVTTASAAAEPIPTLLAQVESCEAAYLGADNAWRTAWPGDQTQLKPRAIRIGLTLAGRGKYERVFYLP